MVTVREERRSGREALETVTALLQRARLAHPTAGIWEAADFQWWSRKPRASDAVEQTFWFDADGPVAAVMRTEWPENWACDPIVVPGGPVTIDTVWARAAEILDAHDIGTVETLVRDDDTELPALLAESAFVRTDHTDSTGWMDVAARPRATPVEGFRIVDRVDQAGAPHPMVSRSGDDVEARLRACSLYDPALDLAVETLDGETAGYVLFWADPVTRVGLLEPMRTEDAFQRRGLARWLIAEGLERLAARGATRSKVSWQSDAAAALYAGAGYVQESTTTTYRRQR